MFGSQSCPSIVFVKHFSFSNPALMKSVETVSGVHPGAAPPVVDLMIDPAVSTPIRVLVSVG